MWIALLADILFLSTANADDPPAATWPAGAATSGAAIRATSGTPPSASQELDAVTKIADRAIGAAASSVDVVKWIYSLSTVLATSLVGVPAFLGYQNIKSTGESVRQQARDQVDDQLHEFKETVGAATVLAIRTQAALRYVFLAEKWAGEDDNRKQALRNANAAIKEARVAATTLGNQATQAWTYVFEAYSAHALENFSEAVNLQNVAMTIREREDPLDVHNLACYCARAGDLNAAKRHLLHSIAVGSELYRRLARRKSDFNPLRTAARVG